MSLRRPVRKALIAIRKIPNYPKGRKPYRRRGRIYPWRRRKWGKVALILLHFYLKRKKEVEQWTHESEYFYYGFTAEGAYAYLRRTVPELFEDYKDYTGREMPVELPRSRVYMWFLKAQQNNGGCEKKITDEHPLNWRDKAEEEWNIAISRDLLEE